MIYTCEHCKKTFNQKGDYSKHLNKKNACIPMSSVNEIIEQKNVKNSKVSDVIDIFKSIMNVLRNDASHITGDEVLFEMSHFLILKMVEPHIVNGNINIYEKSYYAEGLKKYKEDFWNKLELIKFSKFFEYSEADLYQSDFLSDDSEKIKNKDKLKSIYDGFLWNLVLSKHPTFKGIFEEGQKSRIKESNTIYAILKILNPIDFEKNYNFDVLGEAYESIFVDAVFGAGQSKKGELGQFFTPTKVKNLLVKLVDPKLLPNGELESVFDPSCGTGGILNTVIKHYKTFINDFFTEEKLRVQLMDKIFGIEIKDKIFNLCMSNMLINTGKVLPHVCAGDSIRKFHSISVDCIIANPPFSVKIDYDTLHISLEFKDSDGNKIAGDELLKDYIPIKAGGKNSELLFLQMMIHCLKIDGRCATVMLDGDKMYGTSSGYDNVRQYLLRSCELHKVIMCPSGTFTSTGTKTCILFFTKKQEREKVLSWKKKGSTYDWKGKFSTKMVEFLDYNPDTEQLYPLIKVGIEQIFSKNFSLRYSDYVVEEEKDEKERNDLQYFTLNEVCEFQNGYAFKSTDYISEDNNNLGIISIKCIQNGKVEKNKISDFYQYDKSLEKFEIIKNDFLIALSGATTGKIGIYNFNYKSYLNQRVAKITCKSCLNQKYLYYWYIGSNIEKYILKLSAGSAQPNISTKTIGTLKIPVPSIEKQNKIVEFIDELYENRKIKIQDTIEYFGDGKIFNLLLDEDFDSFKKLIEWQEYSVFLQNNINLLKQNQEIYLDFSTRKFEKKCLDEFCEFQNGYAFKSTDYISEDNNNLGIISIKCIQNGKVEKNKISDFYQYDKSLEKFEIIKNDFLIALSGATTGKIGIYNFDYKSYLNQRVAKITCKSSLNQKYLYYWYIGTNIEKYILKLSSGSAQPNISTKTIGALKIPFSSLEDQQKIIDYCDKVSKNILEIEQEIQENKEIAQSFLQSICDSNNFDNSIVSDNVSDYVSDNVSDNDSEIDDLDFSEKLVIEDDIEHSDSNSFETVDSKKISDSEGALSIPRKSRRGKVVI